MKIESPEFQHESAIPSKFTCDGEDVAPPLKITGVPKDAKTLALIVDDPDAASGAWVHWTVWNIPAEASVTIEGGLPGGTMQGVTSSGNIGYAGPCPPSGTHRYFFKAYALDGELDLSPETMVEALMQAMEGHTLDKAQLVGLYERL